MSNVVRGITCFLHGTDGYGFNKILFLLALNIVQQMIDGFGNICLGPTGTYLVTEAGDELCQVIQFLRVWKVVDTVREYLGLLVFRYATDFFCYGAVGKQHEFFHQLVGIFGNFEVDADRFSFFVYLKLHFVTVEVDGSGYETLLTQCLGNGIQHKDFFFEVSFFRFNYLLCFLVSKAAVGLDYCMYYA